jgi:hypothetical protein
LLVGLAAIGATARRAGATPAAVPSGTPNLALIALVPGDVAGGRVLHQATSPMPTSLRAATTVSTVAATDAGSTLRFSVGATGSIVPAVSPQTAVVNAAAAPPTPSTI